MSVRLRWALRNYQSKDSATVQLGEPERMDDTPHPQTTKSQPSIDAYLMEPHIQ